MPWIERGPLDDALAGERIRLSEGLHHRWRGGGRCGAGARIAEHHDDVVAFDSRGVRNELVEVQHEASAILRLRGHDGIETAGAHIDTA